MARLATRTPHIFRADLSLIESLFTSAGEETQSVRFCILEVLSAAATALRRPDAATATRLHAMLMKAVMSNVRDGCFQLHSIQKHTTRNTHQRIAHHIMYNDSAHIITITRSHMTGASTATECGAVGPVGVPVQ
mgnify:CR=1 FL=1